MLFFLALGVAALVVAFVVAVSLGIRVDLEPLREPFQAMASSALGREVKLEGEVFLVPTWSVTVEANGLRIANPETWETAEFAHLDLARVQVNLLPLLWRRLVIRELRAEGIHAVFERRSDGSANWVFPGDDAGSPEPGQEAEAGPAGDDAPAWRALLPKAVVLEELALRDVRAELNDAVEGSERSLALERLDGTAATDAPLEFSMAGRYDGHPFSASLQGGDPTLLIGGDAPWPLLTEFEIAGSRIALAAQVDERDWDFGDAFNLLVETASSPLAGLEGQRLGEMTLTLEGERLDSLDPVLEISLPHWGPHRFEARFEAFGDGQLLADVVTRVGSSELTGKLSIEARVTPPRVELALTAPEVQLADFPLDGWSALEDTPAELAAPEGAEPAARAGTKPAAPNEAEPRETGRALLSPEVMRSLDAKLDVEVARVASGRDWLGKGRLAARLEQGSFHLDAFDIDVAGGSIETSASLTPQQRSIHGTLKLKIERFDYGILARRVAPESDMSGLFAIEVELASTAPDALHLMEHASGRFDAAVFPETLEAGVIDLWAVNLVSAVLPAIDSSEESKVNCFVALLDMKDGVMRQHTLMVDTSRLTVNGAAKIDFRKRWVEIELAPTPKRPEFFSAATPIQVEGSFEDFDIGVAPGQILQTMVSFVTSVVHVPVRRLFSPPQDPEELDTCLAALERK